MSMTKDATKMDLKGYAVNWGGTTLGWTKDVDPTGLKVTDVEKKIEEIGDIIVDRVITGMDGTVKMTLLQVNIDTFRAVIPGAPASGAIPLVPGTQYASRYALAKVLTIHPRGNVDATEDLTLIKAAVKSYMLPKSSDGKTWRSIQIEFEPYPDQTQLIVDSPVIVYGYIGTPPA